jgi:hypothetical protein
MRARSYAEVREVLTSADFRGWFEELGRATQARKDSAERFDELITQSTLLDLRAELAQKSAIDTLYQAGECEDLAARLNAESEELENRSFEAVARFEAHRVKVTEIWYHLGVVEKVLQELREGKELRSELAKREEEYALAEADYRRETERKERLWSEVEQLWQSSAEKSLLLHEKEVQGRKVRKLAERLFREAEDRKLRGRKLRVDADEQSVRKSKQQKRIAELLEEACGRFDCAVGEEFLYFRQREERDGIYAVSLISDSDSYNIEVTPLGVYRVDRQHGVGLMTLPVEPRSSPTPER